MRFLIFTLLVITLSPLNAQAKSLFSKSKKKLNDKIITSFINDTTAIATGQDSRKTNDQIREYLEKHIHEDARFKSKMIYNIPGFPSQENSMSVTKEEYIENTLRGASTLNDYSTDITIESIDLSKDKTKATVRTIGMEDGVMPIKDETGNMQDLPIEGVSACMQILRMSKDNVLQMYHADCDTRITFTGGF